MPDIKISELTAKGTAIASTDLVEISESNGTGGFVTKSVTGANILASKQNTLVSGTNIKTIENISLLGSGNIDLSKSDVGLGSVDNTSDVSKPISTATQNALNNKQNTITNSDSITEGATNLFLTSVERNKLVNTSGTNTGDQTNISGTANNVTGIVAVANGGTGTATPSLVAGTNITLSGTFPNQTINASGGGGVTQLIAGTNITLSPAGGTGVVTVNASGGGGGGGVHVLVAPTSNIQYNARLNSGNTFLTVPTNANQIVLWPFIPANSITIKNFITNVTTAVAGGLIRILVYSDLNGNPTTKLFESTDIDASIAGDKTFITPFTFTAGTTFWLAIHSNLQGIAIPIVSASQAIVIGSQGVTFANLTTRFSNTTYPNAPATLSSSVISNITPYSLNFTAL